MVIIGHMSLKSIFDAKNTNWTDQFPNPERFSVGLLLSLVSFTIASMQLTTYLGKRDQVTMLLD